MLCCGLQRLNFGNKQFDNIIRNVHRTDLICIPFPFSFCCFKIDESLLHKFLKKAIYEEWITSCFVSYKLGKIQSFLLVLIKRICNKLVYVILLKLCENKRFYFFLF